jgi:hypothetical protein
MVKNAKTPLRGFLLGARAILAHTPEERREIVGSI